LESRGLNLGEAVNRSEWGLLTLLEIDMVIVCGVVVWKFIGLALAENVEKFVVLGRNLIMERFEFLRIKGVRGGSGNGEVDFRTVEERFRVGRLDLKYTGLFTALSMHPERCGIDKQDVDRLHTFWQCRGCGGC